MACQGKSCPIGIFVFIGSHDINGTLQCSWFPGSWLGLPKQIPNTVPLLSPQELCSNVVFTPTQKGDAQNSIWVEVCICTCYFFYKLWKQRLLLPCVLGLSCMGNILWHHFDFALNLMYKTSCDMASENLLLISRPTYSAVLHLKSPMSPLKMQVEGSSNQWEGLWPVGREMQECCLPPGELKVTLKEWLEHKKGAELQDRTVVNYPKMVMSTDITIRHYQQQVGNCQGWPEKEGMVPKPQQLRPKEDSLVRPEQGGRSMQEGRSKVSWDGTLPPFQGWRPASKPTTAEINPPIRLKMLLICHLSLCSG